MAWAIRNAIHANRFARIIRNWNPYFYSADSHETLEFPIRANHATKFPSIESRVGIPEARENSRRLKPPEHESRILSPSVQLGTPRLSEVVPERAWQLVMEFPAVLRYFWPLTLVAPCSWEFNRGWGGGWESRPLSHFCFVFVFSSGASGGSLHGGAIFKVEKTHFSAWKRGPENRKNEVKLRPPLCRPLKHSMTFKGFRTL